MATAEEKYCTATGTGKQPSWFRSGDSVEESIFGQKQLKISLEKERQQLNLPEQSNVVAKINHHDSCDQSDDSDDDSNPRTILPTNLQVQDTITKRGLFRRGRRNDMAASVSTDHPTSEMDGGYSVTGSYMNGFCVKSVQSHATTGSLFSIISRFLPFGFNKESNVNNYNSSNNKKPTCPPLPPKRPPLPPSRKDTTKKKPPRQQPPLSQQPTSTPNEQKPLEATVHSSVPDSTPTYKSISTMDTEECTFEGGVPAVIYCFIKVNPYDNDDDNDDNDLGYNNGGLRSFLPKAIAKRLPKSKQTKQFIDENDEESYFQTLVAL
jgi:hypothetical protein